MSVFKLREGFNPAGDQPKAIKQLVEGLEKGMRYQTLLGATGTGKTFTMANVIEQIGKPTLVIAHNKTLAAQLAQEFREFFPENAVHYFVSYYDYYQPEAYIAHSDTYIEKEAMINEEIERLRHASTQALLTRKDVIIVASVSCIYGLGSPDEYEKVNLKVEVGQEISRQEFLKKLIGIHYERTTADLKPGLVRAVGNFVEIMPISERYILRIGFEGNTISNIAKIDAVTRAILSEEKTAFIFPTKHFITDKEQGKRAVATIKAELDSRLKELIKDGKNLEAERLKRRTNYDLAMIKEVGYCNGIENYSRHFSGKMPGEAPDSLLSYFPKGFLTIIDESHVTVPQLGAMYAGDASRKQNLVDFGFRLPSARDNRPLKFNEFEERINQVVYTSATPGPYEFEHSEQVVEQIIRPTGLIDPEVIVKPVTEKGIYKGQIQDFIIEAEKVIKKGFRVIGTTLTKKMAEDLSEYLKEKGIKARYLHSDIKTIERIEILTDLRKGDYDILIGVNLLREGIDLPEVALIGIFDADKEGFLRSETSLVQIIGRAARNVEGKVILYADTITKSMDYAMKETLRRRALQIAHNKKYGITPTTIVKKIQDITESLKRDHEKAVDILVNLEKRLFEENPDKYLKEKEAQMQEAVKLLDFETAALIRDEIKKLKGESSTQVVKKSKRKL